MRHETNEVHEILLAERGIETDIHLSRPYIVKGVEIHSHPGSNRRFRSTQAQIRKHNACSIKCNAAGEFAHRQSAFLTEGALLYRKFKSGIGIVNGVDMEGDTRKCNMIIVESLYFLLKIIVVAHGTFVPFKPS